MLPIPTSKFLWKRLSQLKILLLQVMAIVTSKYYFFGIFMQQ
jgi:hypothetical protein